MQDLSFDFRDPVFEFNGLRFSVQVFTFENVYGLDPAACHNIADDHSYTLTCEQLMWAGGQETADGSVTVQAAAGDNVTSFTIDASCHTTIRCVKLVVKDVPQGPIVNLRETPAKAIPADGLVLRYPDGWRGLYTPLVVIRTPQGGFTYARSLDAEVREKRFAFVPRGNHLDLELIFEETATTMTNRVVVPPWEVGGSETRDAVLDHHATHVQRSYKLVPWEQRSDVPAWARKISLVAAIHCQHWTGYVFNDYAKVLRTIQWLAERVEPERMLVYLPGWEGRYYWQYGDYRPDPRMGGTEGFAHLMREAHAIGVHMMPMFGINVVNRGLPNFEQWGAPALTSHAGGVGGGATVDWDGSRHYDHVWGALLNPGAPTWQNRLVTQITALIDTYQFDGVFLDISAVWLNDPRNHTFKGVQQLVQRLRERHPNLLVGGEGWYDAIGAATPLMQSGHTDGRLHWHDEPLPSLFDTYHRCFAHLCLGDGGRGSTGVHELGVNPERRSPLRKGIIPTVTIVEDTLATAEDQIMQILGDAETYAQRYLTQRETT